MNNNYPHSYVSCDYEGCGWLGYQHDLSSHKDRECQFAVHYLRDKCSKLELEIQSLKQQIKQQHSNVYLSKISNKDISNTTSVDPSIEYYHPGTITNYHPKPITAPSISYHPQGKEKKHPGIKIYEYIQEITYQHIWITKHVGHKIAAGSCNGQEIIQWSCCNDKWDNNTANGCEKVCKICNIKFHQVKDPNHGCTKKEESVQVIKWSCCNQIEKCSEFNSKACTFFYKCCGRVDGSQGCFHKRDESKASYSCCGMSVNSYQNNFSSGCQTKWTCCNKSYQHNTSNGCQYRFKHNTRSQIPISAEVHYSYNNGYKHNQYNQGRATNINNYNNNTYQSPQQHQHSATSHTHITNSNTLPCTHSHTNRLSPKSYSTIC